MAQRDPAARSFDELYREIVALPEGITGEILTPGTIRTMSRPGRGHRRAAQAAFRGLGAADRGSGGSGWWIEMEPEVRLLRGRLFVPDLAGWRVERVPSLPDENPIEIVPDWVCEVHSPTTRRDDRHLKLPVYVEAGVPWIWLVDPEARLVEVYVPDGARAVLVASAAGDETPSLPPFELPLTLARWWSDPPAEPAGA